MRNEKVNNSDSGYWWQNTVNFVFSRPDLFWGLVLSLVLMAPLFQWELGFDKDWSNHLWNISFVAAHLSHHGSFPIFLNTYEVIGNPVTAFYATHFYPLMAILALLFGNSKIAVAITFFFTNVAQFVLGYRFARFLKVDSEVSLFITGLLVASTYQITNFYNRAAIPEYLAVAWYFCLIFLLIPFLNIQTKFAESVWRLMTMGFLYTLLFVTHPITFQYGTLFFIPVFGIFWRDLKFDRSKILAFTIPALLFCLIVMPFLILYFKFSAHLYMTKTFSSLIFYLDRIDTFWARLAPLPFDPAFTKAIENVSTPFLEAPVNVCLLVLGAIVFMETKAQRENLKYLMIQVVSLLVLAVGLIWLSLDPAAWNPLPKFLYSIQFGYRLVNYINLIFLLITLRAASRVSKVPYDCGLDWRAVRFAVIGFALCGLVIKLIHSSAVSRTVDEWAYTTNHTKALHLPATFYGFNAYADLDHIRPIPEAEAASVANVRLAVSDSPYAAVIPADFEVGREGFVQTNVLSFPWVHLMLNGSEIPKEKQGYLPLYNFVRFWAPVGKHRLTVEFEVDPIYARLRTFSFFMFFSWIACLAIYYLHRSWYPLLGFYRGLISRK